MQILQSFTRAFTRSEQYAAGEVVGSRLRQAWQTVRGAVRARRHIGQREMKSEPSYPLPLARLGSIAAP